MFESAEHFQTARIAFEYCPVPLCTPLADRIQRYASFRAQVNKKAVLLYDFFDNSLCDWSSERLNQRRRVRSLSIG